MSSILGILKDFINNLKYLTLPGVFAALGFVILLWPPQSVDVVHDVRIRDQYKGTNWRPDAKRPEKRPGQSPQEPGAQHPEELAAQTESVCTFTPAALPNPQSLQEARNLAVTNQFHLERIARDLRECSEKEKALSGVEDSQITAGNAEIAVLIKERDGFQDSYLNYEKNASSLADHFRDLLDRKQKEIKGKQLDIRDIEQIKRERDRRAAELDRYSKEISERLADPGRLRPRAKFDDFMASLSNHVIAFLVLALGWSLLFEPINRALFGMVYDNAFRERLDVVYESRLRPVVRAKRISRTVWLVFSGLFAVVLLSAITSSWFARGAATAVHDPCKLEDRSCDVLARHAPGLTGVLVNCFLWTLAGLLISVLLSWIVTYFLYKTKMKKARAQMASQAEIAMKAEMDAYLEKPRQEEIAKQAEMAKQQTRAAEKEFEKADTAGGVGREQLWLMTVQRATRGAKPEPKPKAAEAPQPTCEEKLAALWNKISQPEFAIGQGLITRDDYNNIREQYYGQSQMSTGMILPVMFVAFSVLSTPELGITAGLPIWVLLSLVQALLLYVAADRRHKYETEVETSISSRFLKTCEAKTKKPPDDKQTITDLVNAAIKAQLKNLKIANTGLEIIQSAGDEPKKEPS